MKRLLILIILVSLASISCHKISPESFEGKLTGKWRYTQAYGSIGSGFYYTSKEALKQWIIFNDNGSFSTNMPKFINVKSYKILDSSTIKFFTPQQQPASLLFYYSFNPAINSLSLSSADFICIEGCGDIFKK